jgi:lipopolysaccharide export system permease protein
MRRRLFRPLDRYVASEFTKIFISTTLGFPILLTIIDLTDNLDKYLSRNLTTSAIALSYVYWIPENVFMVLPAATLFATVFTIGGLTRHSEITAAKASGISFHRLTLPIYLLSFVAVGLTLTLSELAPLGSRRRNELLQEVKFTSQSERYNFAFAAEHGRIYKVETLEVPTRRATGLEIDRKGRENDPTYPTWILSSLEARWMPAPQPRWTLINGTLHVMPGHAQDITFSFDSLFDRNMTETPAQLISSQKAPTDMRYRELGQYIAALERSGSDVRELRVERALKIAIPVTCVIIALFGAPLATSSQRGGAAYGIGVSLGITITFLVFIQLTKAIGGSNGPLTPEQAAWLPNAAFGLGGLLLLWRVRT